MSAEVDPWGLLKGWNHATTSIFTHNDKMYRKPPNHHTNPLCQILKKRKILISAGTNKPGEPPVMIWQGGGCSLLAGPS